MKPLLLLVAALIVYGSIFPFELREDPVAADEFLSLAGSWTDSTSRGDALGNIALLVPYGFLGMFAFAGAGRSSRRLWLTFASGFLLAAGVQVLQLYFVGRVPTFVDVVFNTIGLVGGALLAIFWPRKLRFDQGAMGAPGARVAVGLMGLWVIARLMPLVPSIDFQSIKDSLKPLLLDPQFVWSSIAEGFVAWLIVAHLWQGLRARVWTERYLPLLMAGVFAGEVLVVGNVVSASNVLGAAAALLAWWSGLRFVRPTGRATFLACSLASLLILRGWAPFEQREYPASMAWIPFADALGGSMVINATAWVEKSFFFGSMIWLLKERGLSLRLASVLTALLTLVIEIGQVWFAHHTPAITDPLLALLAGLSISVVVGPRSGTDSVNRRTVIT